MSRPPKSKSATVVSHQAFAVQIGNTPAADTQKEAVAQFIDGRADADGIIHNCDTAELKADFIAFLHNKDRLIFALVKGVNAKNLTRLSIVYLHPSTLSPLDLSFQSLAAPDATAQFITESLTNVATNIERQELLQQRRPQVHK